MAHVSYTFSSGSPGDTQRLGCIIGELAHPGDIILLSGPLGAGKTCLAQGVARGLGVTGGTTSPSYVLVREFAGRLPLYHMDLYRLEFNEIDELGMDDYLYGRGVCLIEWAEKAAELMPAGHLLINLVYGGESERNIDIVPDGTRYEEMARQIATALGCIQKDKK